MTFAAFLTQYEATGREKADGYFPAHFSGMSDDERARARAMMLDRALDGDTIDMNGLRLIGDDGTAVRLEAAGTETVRFGFRLDIVRRETLFGLTGDPRHLAGCLTWLDDADPSAREFAAEALARHRLPPDLADPLARRLADGQHEDIALPLAIAWLGTHGLDASAAEDFQRHLPFIRSVLNTPPARRPAVLATGVR